MWGPMDSQNFTLIQSNSELRAQENKLPAKKTKYWHEDKSFCQRYINLGHAAQT